MWGEGRGGGGNWGGDDLGSESPLRVGIGPPSFPRFLGDSLRAFHSHAAGRGAPFSRRKLDATPGSLTARLPDSLAPATRHPWHLQRPDRSQTSADTDESMQGNHREADRSAGALNRGIERRAKGSRGENVGGKGGIGKKEKGEEKKIKGDGKHARLDGCAHSKAWLDGRTRGVAVRSVATSRRTSPAPAFLAIAGKEHE